MVDCSVRRKMFGKEVLIVLNDIEPEMGEDIIDGAYQEGLTFLKLSMTRQKKKIAK